MLAHAPDLVLTMGGGGRATGADRPAAGHPRRRPALPGDDRRRRSATWSAVATALGRSAARRAVAAAAVAACAPIARRTRDAIFLAGGGNSIGAGSARRAMDAARRASSSARCPAAGPRLKLLAIRPPQVLLRSTYRRAELSLGQRWLDHPLVAALAARTDRHRRPALDLRGPADDRRNRAIAGACGEALHCPCSLQSRRAAHLLLPLAPLERGAGDRSRTRATCCWSSCACRAPCWRSAMARCSASAARRCRRCSPIPSPRPTSPARRAARRLGAVLGGYWLGFTEPLALAACGAAGALGALVLLLGARRAPRRDRDPAARRPCDRARRRRRDQPGAGARPLALRLLRRLRLADGQLRRPQPRPGRCRACPRRASPARCCCAARSALDLLALGEDVAASLGYRPRRLALEVVALSAIAVGACVAVCRRDRLRRPGRAGLRAAADPRPSRAGRCFPPR